MSKILVMSETLASQVAAGEVVERPASVLKELVENSIDAGAKSIRVEIGRGGISMMKVTDDGCGMSRDDAVTAFHRHATSKLGCVEDLFHITQMGFRGEALPSIASVAHVRLATRESSCDAGTEVRVIGGTIHGPIDAGCAPGTVIEVTNLFFNTPARRKFLKSVETEAGHIEHQLILHALAFPHIRFTFVKDGQTVFDAAATTDMRQRVAAFSGREWAEKLIPIQPTEGAGLNVSGYLLPLSEARRNRQQQYVFLNRRPIDDRIIARAIRDGFGGFPTGLHPALYLFINIEPALVDVNVHPAKREVRFRRPADLAACIMNAIAATLAAHARAGESPEAPTGDASDDRAGDLCASESATATAPPRLKPTFARPTLQPRQRDLDWSGAETAQPDAPPPEQPRQGRAEPQSPLAPASAGEVSARLPSAAVPAPPSAPKGFRHLGTLHDTYALFENADGLVLLSPRAAMERILFERLLAARKRPVEAQRLLEPAIIDMDVREFDLALKLLPSFEQAGFRIEPFGRRTLRVEAVPALIHPNRAEDFMRSLLERFVSGEVNWKRQHNPYEPFAVQVARQSARLEDAAALLARAERLLAELFACEIPYCTPLGKPTLIPYAMSEFRRKFQAS